MVSNSGDCRSNRLRVAYILVLGVLAGILVIRCGVSSVYLNTLPEARYTGINSCASCHQRIYDSFLETGMGKSLYRPDPDQVIERFGVQEAVVDEASDFAYYPYWKNTSLYIREFRLKDGDTIYQRNERIDYIIGSGHQTRSYLIERNGYLYEAPLTWYVSKQIWDMSPGYKGNNSRFSREIGEECLSCHTGHIEKIEGSNNRYRKVSLGIDCEKCHGPGSVHIEAIKGGQLIDVGEEIDYTIVNPAKLPIFLQFDLCQQCHLQGINVVKEGHSVLDFRPGKRLEDVYTVFLEKRQDADAFGIASHAERLQQARCFTQSAGQLTCTSCHDPHKSIARTEKKIFIQQCMNCHMEEKSPLCSASMNLRKEKEDNCVSCHMPLGGTSDIPHVRFHDHKIRIVNPRQDSSLRDDKKYLELICATDSSVNPGLLGKAWLQYFERFDPNPAYLGTAASYLAKEDTYSQAQLAFYQKDYTKAVALIQQSPVPRYQADTYYLFKGEILQAAGQLSEAITALGEARKRNPENLTAAIKYGVALLKAQPGNENTLIQVREIFVELLERNQRDKRIFSNLGFVEMHLGNFRDAEQYLHQALKLDPDYLQAWINLVQVKVRMGKKVAALESYRRLAEIEPGHPVLVTLRQLIGIQ